MLGREMVKCNLKNKQILRQLQFNRKEQIQNTKSKSSAMQVEAAEHEEYQECLNHDLVNNQTKQLEQFKVIIKLYH